MQFHERLDVFLNAKRLTPYALSKEIGVSLNTFYKTKERKSGVSSDVLTKLAFKFRDLNTRWLLTGEGEMLEFRGENSNSQRGVSEVTSAI